MTSTYDHKRKCIYCRSMDWASCFTDNRCRNCHKNYIEEEYERIHGKKEK